MLFRLILIFFVSGVQPSRVVFDRVEVIENSNYMKTSTSIDNSGDMSSLNWNITMRRRLQLKITMKTDLYVLPNTRQSLLPIPRLNYCDLGFHSKTIPFLSNIYELIEQYGGQRLTRCPIEPGFYAMENIRIESNTITGLSAIRMKGQYMVQLHLQDENGKKPVTVYKYRIFVSYE